MFYEPQKGHDFQYDPFKAILAPRPIGWISTINNSGVRNLAPYSFFSAISSKPHMIGFSSEGFKDTVANAQETGEFVYNLVSSDLVHLMSASSQPFPSNVDEFERAGLETAKSRTVKPPRIAGVPAAMECKVISCTQLSDQHGALCNTFHIIGQVTGIYIDDSYLNNGLFDTLKAAPLARCGYLDYSPVKEIFQLKRPE